MQWGPHLDLSHYKLPLTLTPRPTMKRKYTTAMTRMTDTSATRNMPQPRATPRSHLRYIILISRNDLHPLSNPTRPLRCMSRHHTFRHLFLTMLTTERLPQPSTLHLLQRVTSKRRMYRTTLMYPSKFWTKGRSAKIRSVEALLPHATYLWPSLALAEL